MKILHVVGARPNFMKAAPITREMAKYPQEFKQLLVHTGQHYDDNMSQVFFEHLERCPSRTSTSGTATRQGELWRC